MSLKKDDHLRKLHCECTRIAAVKQGGLWRAAICEHVSLQSNDWLTLILNDYEETCQIWVPNHCRLSWFFLHAFCLISYGPLRSMIRWMTLTITVPAYSSSVNAVFQRLETDPLMVLRPSFFSHSHFFSWLFSSLPPDILSQESPNRTCRINYILLRSEESSEFGEHQELHHKSPRQRHWSH